MASATRILAAKVDSGDAFEVKGFSVRERISTLFEIKLLAFCENPNVDFNAVLGRPASFRLDGGYANASPRVWTGLCNHIQQVEIEGAGRSTYELAIVPPLWLATQRRNHRMFQQISELDIAKKLLGEWGIEPVLRITGLYKKRKYRVQYGESDYAFLCRMLEDAGISFYFEQGDVETHLVLVAGPRDGDAWRAAVCADAGRDLMGDAIARKTDRAPSSGVIPGARSPSLRLQSGRLHPRHRRWHRRGRSPVEQIRMDDSAAQRHHPGMKDGSRDGT